MGILDAFRVKKPADFSPQRATYAKPPVTTVTISSQAAQSYSSMFLKGKELEQKRNFWEIYQAGGPASMAIDVKVNSIWTNGWKITGDDQELNDAVKRALEWMDFDIHAKMATRDGFLFKWGIHEIAMTQSGKKRLVTRSSKDFLRIDDPVSGEPSEFVQRIGNSYTGIEKRLSAKDAIMITPIMTADGQGISLIERAQKQIEWYDKISTSSADAIYRHGNPVWQIQLGSPDGTPVPADVVSGMESITTDLDARAELVTNAATSINELNKSGVPNIESYGNWAMTQLCTSIGVPELLMGMGHRSTEATAQYALRAFYDTVASEQFTIAAQYQDRLIDDVILYALGRPPGACKFTFNNPNPENDSAKADYLAKIAAINPMDSFALMSLDEMKQYLGIQTEEELPPEVLR